jgi:hypothetical protein
MLTLRTIIGLLILVLILVLVLPLAALKNSAQESIIPLGTTQESPVNHLNGDSETPTLFDVSEASPSPELPLVLVTETTSPTNTLFPTDVTPVPFSPSSTPRDFAVVIYTPSPTVIVFPTEILPIEISPTNSYSEIAPSITPASTIELSQDFVTTVVEGTIGEATETMQPSSVSITCELDLDADGIVTDDDLSQLGRSLLNSPINDRTSIYDLNANSQLDIGDLQKMAAFLFESCTN